MKPRLVPLYFDPGRDGDFDVQLNHIRELIGADVELLEPVALGKALPPAEAVIFPQILGEAYRSLGHFQQIKLPILILTSPFGTIAMWDWEIIEYLRAEGVATLAPYSFEQTKKIVAALRVKRELATAKFLVFQDDPGEGRAGSDLQAILLVGRGMYESARGSIRPANRKTQLSRIGAPRRKPFRMKWLKPSWTTGNGRLK